MGLHKVKKLLQIKGNCYQNHYATHRMGEKSLQDIQQRIDIQNIKRTKKLNIKRMINLFANGQLINGIKN
jgi:hypothetical protein